MNEPIQPLINIPESCHWYDKYGGPVLEVPYKTPKKDAEGNIVATHRAPTLMDARKYGLCPSVSLMSRWPSDTAGLDNWKRNLWVDATIRSFLPELVDDVEAWKKRVVALDREVEEEATTRGTEMHKFIQQTIIGETVEMDAASENACTHIMEWLGKKALTDDAVERCFTNEIFGLGGTIDYVGYNWEDKLRVVCDWKTTNHKSFEKMLKRKNRTPYDNHARQVVSYAKLTQDSQAVTDTQCWIAYISQQTGATCFVQQPYEDEPWDQLMAIYAAWKAVNRHDVVALWKQGIAETAAKLTAPTK